MEKGGLPALPGLAGQVSSRPELGVTNACCAGLRVSGSSSSPSRMPKTTSKHVPGAQGASIWGTSKEVGLRQGGEGSSLPGRMAEEQSKHCTCPRASSGPLG